MVNSQKPRSEAQLRERHTKICTQISDAETYLNERWRCLRDGAASVEMAYVRGAIEALRSVGGMTDDGAELWLRRIETCPGHDDESGRDWCAYCGQMWERACKHCHDTACTFREPRCLAALQLHARARANGMPASGRHG